MATSKKQDRANEISRAKNVLRKYSNEIKKFSHGRKPGIGFKFENGKMTDKVAFIFYVPKKKSKEEIFSEGGVPIPEEIGGIPTDVIEVPRFEPRKEDST
jgi:hypothetical protein